MTETLTDADVAFFRENGYLLPGRRLLSEDRLARLELIFNEHLRNKGDKLSDELDTPPSTRTPPPTPPDPLLTPPRITTSPPRLPTPPVRPASTTTEPPAP